jgi:thiol-disulfide isomerase/thioredoxin
MNTKQTIAFLALIILVIGGIFMLPRTSSKEGAENPNYKNLNEFAQCLKDKEVVMYGAYWCSHCKAQKELFGSAFKNVNYVECTENTKLCTDQGVKVYPTWKFKGGKILEGEQTFESLAKESSCVLEPVEAKK